LNDKLRVETKNLSINNGEKWKQMKTLERVNSLSQKTLPFSRMNESDNKLLRAHNSHNQKAQKLFYFHRRS
jgi:hypothetical protein